MKTNPLKDFAKASCSILEQDKSAQAEGMGGQSVKNVSGVERLKDRQSLFEIGEQIPDLHGFRPVDPANERKYEKYEHRIIAELKSAGKTNQEICEITGYCATSISAITKLPWVKQFIMDEIHRRGGQQVIDYMSQNAMPAAKTVVEGFMDEEMPRGRDRVAAANSLLDRLFGKANQNITTHKGADLSKVTDEELAAIAQSPQN